MRAIARQVLGLAAVLLWAGGLGAQVPEPVPPVAADTAVEARADGSSPGSPAAVASEPAPETAPGLASEPVPAAESPRRGLLLPIEFTVYQAGVGGRLEAVPDWTESARTNLRRAALEVAKARIGIELVDLPELTADERAVLDDYVALARLVVLQGGQLGAKAWRVRKADFDRSLGDGLQFLYEKTGAEFAVLLDGAQVKQTGGSIFMQLALAGAGILAPGGGGTSVMASVLDLKSGEVEWFNSTTGVEVFGMGGKDVRDTSGTQDVLRSLFAPYPAIPALTAK
jgi:hypothetical protein